MNETQTQPESQTQNKSQSQTQTIQVRVFYDIHPDDLFTTHLRPLIILDGKRIYNAFAKERIGRPDMYYILLGSQTYIKLWNDSRKNILVYVSSVYDNNLFFDRDAEILTVNTIIYYDRETKTLSCSNSKTIKLDGFDIIGLLDQLAPHLISPVLALICLKLTS